MRTLAVVFALVVVPRVALAQDNPGLGLDLTQDSAKKDDSQPSTPQQTSQQAITDAPEAVPVVEPKTPREPILGEKEIVQEDRVKAIQRKLYLKTHRFEFAPSVFTTVNDPFYYRVGIAGRLSYFFADSVGFGVRGAYYQTLATDSVSTAKRTFYSQITYSQPQWSALGDFEWSPLYGKATIFNSIIHFDGYVITGLGAMKTETSFTTGHGLSPAGDLGIGLRFAFLDFLALNLSFIDTAYVDQPSGTIRAATQNLMTINLGISLFIPFKSTSRESE